MLGWHISVYPLDAVESDSVDLASADPGQVEALRHAAESHGDRIAVWQTGVRGLKWIDELVTGGQAIEIASSGYPMRYVAPVRHVLPRIKGSPPQAREVWIHDPGDIITSGWEGKTNVDRKAAAGRSPDELLLVEAWDES